MGDKRPAEEDGKAKAKSKAKKSVELRRMFPTELISTPTCKPLPKNRLAADAGLPTIWPAGFPDGAKGLAAHSDVWSAGYSCVTEDNAMKYEVLEPYTSNAFLSEEPDVEGADGVAMREDLEYSNTAFRAGMKTGREILESATPELQRLPGFEPVGEDVQDVAAGPNPPVAEQAAEAQMQADEAGDNQNPYEFRPNVPPWHTLGREAVEDAFVGVTREISRYIAAAESDAIPVLHPETSRFVRAVMMGETVHLRDKKEEEEEDGAIGDFLDDGDLDNDGNFVPMAFHGDSSDDDNDDEQLQGAEGGSALVDAVRPEMVRQSESVKSIPECFRSSALFWILPSGCFDLPLDKKTYGYIKSLTRLCSKTRSVLRRSLHHTETLMDNGTGRYLAGISAMSIGSYGTLKPEDAAAHGHTRVSLSQLRAAVAAASKKPKRELKEMLDLMMKGDELRLYQIVDSNACYLVDMIPIGMSILAFEKYKHIGGICRMIALRTIDMAIGSINHLIRSCAGYRPAKVTDEDVTRLWNYTPIGAMHHCIKPPKSSDSRGFSLPSGTMLWDATDEDKPAPGENPQSKPQGRIFWNIGKTLSAANGILKKLGAARDSIAAGYDEKRAAASDHPSMHPLMDMDRVLEETETPGYKVPLIVRSMLDKTLNIEAFDETGAQYIQKTKGLFPDSESIMNIPTMGVVLLHRILANSTLVTDEFVSVALYQTSNVMVSLKNASADGADATPSVTQSWAVWESTLQGAVEGLVAAIQAPDTKKGGISWEKTLFTGVVHNSPVGMGKIMSSLYLFYFSKAKSVVVVDSSGGKAERSVLPDIHKGYYPIDPVVFDYAVRTALLLKTKNSACQYGGLLVWLFMATNKFALADRLASKARDTKDITIQGALRAMLQLIPDTVVFGGDFSEQWTRDTVILADGVRSDDLRTALEQGNKYEVDLLIESLGLEQTFGELEQGDETIFDENAAVAHALELLAEKEKSAKADAKRKRDAAGAEDEDEDEDRAGQDQAMGLDDEEDPPEEAPVQSKVDDNFIGTVKQLRLKKIEVSKILAAHVARMDRHRSIIDKKGLFRQLNDILKKYNWTGMEKFDSDSNLDLIVAAIMRESSFVIGRSDDRVSAVFLKTAVDGLATSHGGSLVPKLAEFAATHFKSIEFLHLVGETEYSSVVPASEDTTKLPKKMVAAMNQVDFSAAAASADEAHVSDSLVSLEGVIEHAVAALRESVRHDRFDAVLPRINTLLANFVHNGVLAAAAEENTVEDDEDAGWTDIVEDGEIATAAIGDEDITAAPAEDDDEEFVPVIRRRRRQQITPAVAADDDIVPAPIAADEDDRHIQIDYESEEDQPLGETSTRMQAVIIVKAMASIVARSCFESSIQQGTLCLAAVSKFCSVLIAPGTDYLMREGILRGFSAVGAHCRMWEVVDELSRGDNSTKDNKKFSIEFTRGMTIKAASVGTFSVRMNALARAIVEQAAPGSIKVAVVAKPAAKSARPAPAILSQSNFEGMDVDDVVGDIQAVATERVDVVDFDADGLGDQDDVFIPEYVATARDTLLLISRAAGFDEIAAPRTLPEFWADEEDNTESRMAQERSADLDSGDEYNVEDEEVRPLAALENEAVESPILAALADVIRHSHRSDLEHLYNPIELVREVVQDEMVSLFKDTKMLVGHSTKDKKFDKTGKVTFEKWTDMISEIVAGFIVGFQSGYWPKQFAKFWNQTTLYAEEEYSDIEERMVPKTKSDLIRIYLNDNESAFVKLSGETRAIIEELSPSSVAKSSPPSMILFNSHYLFSPSHLHADNEKTSDLRALVQHSDLSEIGEMAVRDEFRMAPELGVTEVETMRYMANVVSGMPLVMIRYTANLARQQRAFAIAVQTHTSEVVERLPEEDMWASALGCSAKANAPSTKLPPVFRYARMSAELMLSPTMIMQHAWPPTGDAKDENSVRYQAILDAATIFPRGTSPLDLFNSEDASHAASSLVGEKAQTPDATIRSKKRGVAELDSICLIDALLGIKTAETAVAVSTLRDLIRASLCAPNPRLQRGFDDSDIDRLGAVCSKLGFVISDWLDEDDMDRVGDKCPVFDYSESDDYDDADNDRDVTFYAVFDIEVGDMLYTTNINLGMLYDTLYLLLWNLIARYQAETGSSVIEGLSVVSSDLCDLFDKTTAYTASRQGSLGTSLSTPFTGPLDALTPSHKLAMVASQFYPADMMITTIGMSDSVVETRRRFYQLFCSDVRNVIDPTDSLTRSLDGFILSDISDIEYVAPVMRTFLARHAAFALKTAYNKHKELEAAELRGPAGEEGVEDAYGPDYKEMHMHVTAEFVDSIDRAFILCDWVEKSLSEDSQHAPTLDLVVLTALAMYSSMRTLLGVKVSRITDKDARLLGVIRRSLGITRFTSTENRLFGRKGHLKAWLLSGCQGLIAEVSEINNSISYGINLHGPRKNKKLVPADWNAKDYIDSVDPEAAKKYAFLLHRKIAREGEGKSAAKLMEQLVGTANLEGMEEGRDDPTIAHVLPIKAALLVNFREIFRLGVAGEQPPTDNDVIRTIRDAFKHNEKTVAVETLRGGSTLSNFISVVSSLHKTCPGVITEDLDISVQHLLSSKHEAQNINTVLRYFHEIVSCDEFRSAAESRKTSATSSFRELAVGRVAGLFAVIDDAVVQRLQYSELFGEAAVNHAKVGLFGANPANEIARIRVEAPEHGVEKKMHEVLALVNKFGNAVEKTTWPRPDQPRPDVNIPYVDFVRMDYDFAVKIFGWWPRSASRGFGASEVASLQASMRTGSVAVSALESGFHKQQMQPWSSSRKHVPQIVTEDNILEAIISYVDPQFSLRKSDGTYSPRENVDPSVETIRNRFPGMISSVRLEVSQRGAVHCPEKEIIGEHIKSLENDLDRILRKGAITADDEESIELLNHEIGQASMAIIVADLQAARFQSMISVCKTNPARTPREFEGKPFMSNAEDDGWEYHDEDGRRVRRKKDPTTFDVALPSRILVDALSSRHLTWRALYTTYFAAIMLRNMTGATLDGPLFQGIPSALHSQALFAPVRVVPEADRAVHKSVKKCIPDAFVNMVTALLPQMIASEFHRTTLVRIERIRKVLAATGVTVYDGHVPADQKDQNNSLTYSDLLRLFLKGKCTKTMQEVLSMYHTNFLKQSVDKRKTLEIVDLSTLWICEGVVPNVVYYTNGAKKNIPRKSIGVPWDLYKGVAAASRAAFLLRISELDIWASPAEILRIGHTDTADDRESTPFSSESGRSVSEITSATIRVHLTKTVTIQSDISESLWPVLSPLIKWSSEYIKGGTSFELILKETGFAMTAGEPRLGKMQLQAQHELMFDQIGVLEERIRANVERLDKFVETMRYASDATRSVILADRAYGAAFLECITDIRILKDVVFTALDATRDLLVAYRDKQGIVKIYNELSDAPFIDEEEYDTDIYKAAKIEFEGTLEVMKTPIVSTVTQKVIYPINRGKYAKMFRFTEALADLGLYNLTDAVSSKSLLRSQTDGLSSGSFAAVGRCRTLQGLYQEYETRVKAFDRFVEQKSRVAIDSGFYRQLAHQWSAEIRTPLNNALDNMDMDRTLKMFVMILGVDPGTARTRARAIIRHISQKNFTGLEDMLILAARSVHTNKKDHEKELLNVFWVWHKNIVRDTARFVLDLNRTRGLWSKLDATTAFPASIENQELVADIVNLHMQANSSPIGVCLRCRNDQKDPKDRTTRLLHPKTIICITCHEKDISALEDEIRDISAKRADLNENAKRVIKLVMRPGTKKVSHSREDFAEPDTADKLSRMDSRLQDLKTRVEIGRSAIETTTKDGATTKNFVGGPVVRHDLQIYAMDALVKAISSKNDQTANRALSVMTYNQDSSADSSVKYLEAWASSYRFVIMQNNTVDGINQRSVKEEVDAQSNLLATVYNPTNQVAFIALRAIEMLRHVTGGEYDSVVDIPTLVAKSLAVYYSVWLDGDAFMDTSSYPSMRAILSSSQGYLLARATTQTVMSREPSIAFSAKIQQIIADVFGNSYTSAKEKISTIVTPVSGSVGNVVQPVDLMSKSIREMVASSVRDVRASTRDNNAVSIFRLPASEEARNAAMGQ